MVKRIKEYTHVKGNLTEQESFCRLHKLLWKSKTIAQTERIEEQITGINFVNRYITKNQISVQDLLYDPDHRKTLQRFTKCGNS